MSDDDITANRRTVLKRASVATAAGLLTATGPATALVTSDELDGIKGARDCSCEYEYKCEQEYCSSVSSYTAYRRECCTCDGDTVCESWYEYDCCPEPE
jgi:hypothetical protein